MIATDKFKMREDGTHTDESTFKFTITCNCCGSSAVHMSSKTVRKDTTNPFPIMVVNSLMCTQCHNAVDYAAAIFPNEPFPEGPFENIPYVTSDTSKKLRIVQNS